MIIKNKSKRCLRVEGVVLTPGVNVLNEEQSNKIVTTEFVDNLITNGVLEIPAVSDIKEEKKSVEVAEKAISISNLNSKDAVNLIDGIVNKNTLENLLDEETNKSNPRATVIRAIEKQIQKILDAQEGGKKDDDEENN